MNVADLLSKIKAQEGMEESYCNLVVGLDTYDEL